MGYYSTVGRYGGADECATQYSRYELMSGLHSTEGRYGGADEWAT